MIDSEVASSPRTWGCFRCFTLSRRVDEVFPTHVGVFLASSRGPDDGSSLPHARGGVSGVQWMRKGEPRSSPRTWGCFRLRGQPAVCQIVFPTHVGVFPCLTGRKSTARSLPHARGGVSDGGPLWQNPYLRCHSMVQAASSESGPQAGPKLLGRARGHKLGHKSTHSTLANQLDTKGMPGKPCSPRFGYSMLS